VPIYALGDVEPRIHPDAFVHPDATVIGNVTIGAESTIWPQAVLRGDYGYITIGARTSIQDGTVVHCTAEYPTIIGDDCVVGHLAHLECCIVHDRALVGTGSIVLHRAVVESGALVGAGAVVPNGMVVPAGAMALGVPAKLRPDTADTDDIARIAKLYVGNASRYRAELRRLDA
jgi:carbonic anhydrase/acetyltransferase-like protein (isoleucine patch superfamily)